MSEPTNVEVLLISSDPNWLMRLSEALGRIVAKKFQSAHAAFAEVGPHRPVVIVAGPADLDALFDAPDEVRANPSVASIAVVESLHVDVLRQAMAAGVGDVLGAAQLGDLQPTVEHLWERVNRPSLVHRVDTPALHPGKVVVVTSTKAGQGATTVATNLATTLVGRGPTALIEGDPRYGDLLDALGYRQLRTELVRAGTLPGHWLDRFLYRHPSGVVLVLPRQDTDQSVLQPDDAVEAVALLQEEFDHTVIDVPRWALEQYHVHRLADLVLMVSTGRERDLARVPLAMHTLGLGPEHTRLVISGYAEGETVKRRDIARITGVEPAAVLPWSDAAETAFSSGRPMVELVPDLAGAFEALADEVGAALAGG